MLVLMKLQQKRFETNSVLCLMVKRKEDTVKPGSKNQLLKPWLYHVWAWILWDLMHPKDLASLLYVCVLHMPSVVPDGTGTGGPLHRKNL